MVTCLSTPCFWGYLPKEIALPDGRHAILIRWKSGHTTAVGGKIIRDTAVLVDQSDGHTIIYRGIGRGVAILIGRIIGVDMTFSQKGRDLV